MNEPLIGLSLDYIATVSGACQMTIVMDSNVSNISLPDFVYSHLS